MTHVWQLTWALLCFANIRPRYEKFIKKATKERDVHGSLLYSKQHNIYLLLQGSEEALKSYIHLNRCKKGVDVDKNGRPCKERLLEVLRMRECDRNDVPFQGLKVGPSPLCWAC